jgi:hypothetical protein
MQCIFFNKKDEVMDILRNIGSLILGIVAGMIVNYTLITMGNMIIVTPLGGDISSPDGLKASMPLFEWQHFVFPFLAHALGTFVGAAIASHVAADNKIKFALTIGFFFLMGSVANMVLLPAPLWFSILDFVLAYVPMAYLGWTVADAYFLGKR